jgi:flavin reductase (DIM6/NTAB) family NADH-FMN oxidoreductase RutF
LEDLSSVSGDPMQANETDVAGQAAEHEMIDPTTITSRERYQLLTSLVIPRPIGWISSRSASGVANLAPFSYFAALAATPMLIGVSIGARRGAPKDSLLNIRETGSFCINVVTEQHLEAMNESAGEHPPHIDEFEIAGLEPAEGERVAAPYVAGCPAVLECRLQREVDLDGKGAVLVIGEVVAVRIGGGVEFQPGTRLVDPETLRPVARLGGQLYSLLGEVLSLPRPDVVERSSDLGAP